jgi:hypothetical protein
MLTERERDTERYRHTYIDIKRQRDKKTER